MKHRFCLLATLGFVGATATAYATPVVLGTQTLSFSNQPTELNGSPALTFNLFNGTGTLQEVTIAVTGSLSASGTVTNTARAPQTFTVSLLPQQFDLYASGGAPSAIQNYTDPNTGSQGAFSLVGVNTIGSQRYASAPVNVAQSFGPFARSLSAAQANFTSLSDVASFVGGGTFSLMPFTAIATAIAGGGGNVATNITPLASASVTVTYLGEPVAAVPEPASFALLAAGVAVVVGASRRRKGANGPAARG